METQADMTFRCPACNRTHFLDNTTDTDIITLHCDCHKTYEIEIHEVVPYVRGGYPVREQNAYSKKTIYHGIEVR